MMNGNANNHTEYMDKLTQQWYLIYTKPRQEERAIVNLERQGYRTYYPKFQNKKRVRGVWKKVVEPLFPNYIFLELNASKGNWLPVRSTFGVSRVVKFGSQPALVDPELIHSIQEKVNEHEHIVENPVFYNGQKVQIVEGPMKDLEAIFQCYSGRDRVALLINILGQQTQLHIKYHHVAPVVT